MRAPSILALLFVAAGAGSAQVSIEGRYHDGAADRARIDAPSSAVADLTAAPEVGLGPLEAEDAPVRRNRAARRVGRVRDMAADAVQKGSWTALPDGRFVWVCRFGRPKQPRYASISAASTPGPARHGFTERTAQRLPKYSQAAGCSTTATFGLLPFLPSA